MLNINKASRTICNGICHWQWNSENGFCWSCMEYLNLRIVKYGWRNVEVGCCENRLNIDTANEEAVLKSILLVSLDNSSTLLFILDNSGLKIGNCCWLILVPVSCAFVRKKIQYVDKKWSTSFAGIVLIFNFSYRYLTISGEECSDQ